jgi:hypothetical protein
MAEAKTKTAAQKAAPKKTNAAKPAPVKKAPAVKAAEAKPAAARKAPAAKKAPSAKKVASKWNPGNEERYNMIQVAAYYLAERDSFAGSPVEYWAAAELQVSGMLPKK